MEFMSLSLLRLTGGAFRESVRGAAAHRAAANQLAARKGEEPR